MLLSCLLGVHFWVSYLLRHEYIVSLYDIARLAQFVRFVILSQHFFFMVAVAACMINLVGKAGSTQDGEELQSRRSVECGTCQTVRKRMRLHLSTWLNLMSSILWGTPLPHRGPG